MIYLLTAWAVMGLNVAIICYIGHAYAINVQNIGKCKKVAIKALLISVTFAMWPFFVSEAFDLIDREKRR